MKNNLLEDTPLTPKYIVLNPNDLRIFDKIVGQRNRSKNIRNLIRQFNQKNKI